MENKTHAEKILDEIVQDGTGIEVTQDEALKFAKQIAVLAFDAGYDRCWQLNASSEQDKKTTALNKEQFLKKLFNTK